MTGDPFDREALRSAWKLATDMQRRIYAQQKKIRRRARSGATVADLQMMQAATGDPRFVAAIEAMKAHGFDRKDAGTWKRIFDGDQRLYVRRMHELLTRKRVRSVSDAAAIVAEMFCVGGQSFDAVVKKLERAYVRAKPILTTRVSRQSDAVVSALLRRAQKF